MKEWAIITARNFCKATLVDRQQPTTISELSHFFCCCCCCSSVPSLNSTTRMEPHQGSQHVLWATLSLLKPSPFSELPSWLLLNHFDWHPFALFFLYQTESKQIEFFILDVYFCTETECFLRMGALLLAPTEWLRDKARKWPSFSTDERVRVAEHLGWFSKASILDRDGVSSRVSSREMPL